MQIRVVVEAEEYIFAWIGGCEEKGVKLEVR